MEPKDNKKALTIKDLQNLAFDTVCKNANYPRKKAPALMKEDIEFRHLVGVFLGNEMRGRPTPVQQRGIVPNGEAQRCYRTSLFINAYPKKVVSDGAKFKYLTDKLIKGEITQQIFVEVAEVIPVKKKYIDGVLKQTQPTGLFDDLN